MSVKAIVSVTMLALFAEHIGHCQEWAAVINDLLSDDESVSQAARTKAFGVLIPRLVQEDVAAAAEEVEEISTVLGSKDGRVRTQASALLASVATLRSDGAVAFRTAMPSVLRAFQDSLPRVRSNAAAAVSNLKPTIPNDALQPLLSILNDADARVARGAIYGVARFAQTSSVALGQIESLLASQSDTDKKRGALQAIAVVHLNSPELVAQLGAALDDRDSDVVADALLALRGAGTGALTIYKEKIVSLAKDAGDLKVSRTARAVLTAVPDHK
jgi:hypothetical protein